MTLPAVGDSFEAGQALGEVESTKSVSDVYAPVAGTVSAVNTALDGNPELVNSDPYGEGWLVELTVTDEVAGLTAPGLLDRAGYEQLLP